jgi:hypothetical protein
MPENNVIHHIGFRVPQYGLAPVAQDRYVDEGYVVQGYIENE